ncbi:MAG TPA: 2-oxo acid dehydrogenase subunit E2 [Candidatus Sulfomarinibacteraceae bacterium]|nr:2-oxo acid dehydrogenase subunit E2 [Candidatus Sulfomarinibacteraceae bacterium]
MSTIIRIPELGEGVDSVEVVSVLVEVGDRVELEQPLIEVETDKAAVEVPATAAGTVTEVHVAAGDSLGPDAPIVTVDEETDGGKDAEAQRRRDAEPSQEKADPDPESAAADSVSDSGSDSEQEQRQRAAPADSGSEQGQRPGVASGSAGTEPEQQSATASLPEIKNSELRIENSGRRLVPAAPTVRRFAREVGVDIAAVPGTGPGGRISIDDVKAEVARRMERPAAAAAGAPPVDLPDFSRWGKVRREPMSKIRRLTGEQMSRAWLTAPQVTHDDLADVTDLEALRQRFKGRVEAAGGKLTVTAILVKVAASALKVFPSLNASIDAAAGEIVFKDYVTIGVAVDTEHGLLVPVIRDADRKNITEIAVELDDLAARARARKLKPDEMQGGTFSISNLGGIGGTGFSPIVNWPEVAILGVSRGRVQPEWNDELGSFEPRLVLPLSLSYDHRLVDGAEAARFVRWVAEALEEPLLLALEG